MHAPGTTTRWLLAALTVSVATWIGAPARAGAVELEARGERTATDETVRVSVDVRTPGGLGALEAELAFDPEALTLTTVEPGSLLEGALLEHRAVAPGRVRCALVSSAPIAEEGTLFVARFEARRSEGTTRVDLADVEAWDHADVFEMRVRAQGASIDLTPTHTEGSTPLAFLVGVGIVLLLLFALGRRRRRPRAEAVSLEETSG